MSTEHVAATPLVRCGSDVAPTAGAATSNGTASPSDAASKSGTAWSSVAALQCRTVNHGGANSRCFLQHSSSKWPPFPQCVQNRPRLFLPRPPALGA